MGGHFCCELVISLLKGVIQLLKMGNFLTASSDQGTARMNFFDLANLLDNDGNLQNEMMVMSFAATMLATIPVLLGNEFDVNVGLRKKREAENIPRISGPAPEKQFEFSTMKKPVSKKFFYIDRAIRNKIK